jgi:N6-L-threonylcarbamoyladenine synthase/protein kinase Bud32
VAVGDREIKADYVVVATGSTVNVPDLNGLDEVDYTTSADVLDATEFPDSGVVMGFGYVGLELVPYLVEAAEMDITVIEHDDYPLDEGDEEFQETILDIYREEFDVDVLTNTYEQSVEETADGVSASSEGQSPSDRSSGQGPREGEASGGSSDSSDGVPVEDVCYSLQENVFAMLTEVAERALSLTGSDELVLGGGVGQNARLREMLTEMCDQRGAQFHAPGPQFLRDNAGMIAVLGAEMVRTGDTIPVSDSAVDPDFRPDQVEVNWRDDPESVAIGRERREASPEASPEVKGAEATVEIGDERVTKRRLPKSYRHPELDERLRRDRTVLEARLTSEARRHGVPTPVVYDVDTRKGVLVFEHVGEADLREIIASDASDGSGAFYPSGERVRDVARHLAAIHGAGFVHGDPTTRNVRVENERTYLIDFGLSYNTDNDEDYAMDLHVFAQSLAGTSDDAESLQREFEAAYAEVGDETVLDRLREVEGRGRYQ